MKTDTPLFKKALASLPKKTARQFSPGTPEFIAWLREHRVPEPVVAHFTTYSVTGKAEVEVGFAKFWPEHLIRTFHDDTPEYFGAGWLIVGAMPNGDFVVLDIGGGTGAVSYVSHEEIWDRPHHVRDDLDTITIRICDSIGQFIDGLLEDRYPYDYFDAREREA
ncbi:MAG: hypothetical protein ACTHLW_20370 [Verrucomicrobiota bacterium]